VAEYLLIQISDVHLTPEGSLFRGTLPRANLVAGLAMLAEAGLEPDMFVLTGDLANAGDSACYEDLAEIMDSASRATGATVVYLPGNHDLRSEFRRHLLGQPASSRPINQVHWCGDLRVISLDSVVPDEEFGALTGETLEFLGRALSSPAPDGSILALHHPPIPSPIRPMARIMLNRPEDLAEVIAGSDVRMILCGHNHHEGLGTVASIPVWVSPSSAYRLDVLSRDATHGLVGSAFSRIDITERGATASVIPVPVPGSKRS
jgi:3',5'-cyclic AMP phosphodiesterase CpdA